MLKRILSIVLSVAMLASFSAITVFADAASVEADKTALTMESLLLAPLTEDGYLMDSISLPSSGTNGSAITWQSSDSSVITQTGAVIRPVSQDKNVTLTAAISDGDITETKSFTFKVPALSSQPAGTPKLAGAVVVDEFEDGVIDTSHIEFPTSVSAEKYEESNGSLNLTRSASSETSQMRLKALNYTDYFENGLYAEYVMSRSASKDIYFRSYNTADWTCINAIDWVSDGRINYKSNNESTTVYDWQNKIPYKLKVGIYVDLKNSKQSIWINNEPLISNQYIAGASDATLSGYRYMQIYMQETSYTTVSLESYKLYSVAGATPSANELPTVFGEPIVKNNCDSAEANPNVYGATYTNGKATATHASVSSGSTSIYIYNDPDDDVSLTGVLGIEFDLTRSAAKPLNIKLRDANDYDYTGFTWSDTGRVTAAARNSETGDTSSWTKVLDETNENAISSGAVVGAGKINIKFLIDTRCQLVQLWVNDYYCGKYYSRYKLSDKYVNNFSDLRVYAENTYANTFSIDNYRVYNALPATLDRLEFDMVDFDNFTVAETVNNDIALPTNLTYGSNVAWSSDNAAIANDGIITRGSEDVAVNLTATVSNSTATPVTKTYATVVKADDAVYSISQGSGEAGSYSADFYATKDDGKHKAARYMIALYSGTELVGIKSLSVPDGDFSNEVFAAAAFAASEIPQEANNITAKAFVWLADSEEPLCTSEPISVS